MFKLGKFLVTLVLSGSLLAPAAQALTTITSTGLDASGPEAAFINWQNFVTGEVTDQLVGLNCGGGTTNCTTDAGNVFSTVGPVSISADNFTDGVIQAENLVLDRNGVSPAVITWTLATPAKAFSFFGFDHDGGDIAITFEDGTTQMIEFMAAAGADDNLFVGVYDLSNFVASVTFSSTDPAGISNWDRFSVANVVPIPAALPLFLSALALLGFVRRRKQALGTD